MQGDGKRDGVSKGLAVGLDGREVSVFAASISALAEIIKQVEANVPFSAIKQAYAAPLDRLVKLAGRNKDVNLLARLHAVMTILEAEEGAAREKDLLIAQVSQLKTMLQERPGRSQRAAKGIINGQQTPAPIDMLPSQVSFCEDLLRSFPSIGDQEIKIFKEQGLLDEDRLLTTDALELARNTGIATNTAFEIKDLLHRRVEQHARQDVAGCGVGYDQCAIELGVRQDYRG